MAKAGFFTYNGALGIGGSSANNLKSNFSTTSTGDFDTRLLVDDNTDNSIMRVYNNHFINMDANITILHNASFNKITNYIDDIDAVELNMGGNLLNGELLGVIKTNILEFKPNNNDSSKGVQLSLSSTPDSPQQSYNLELPTSSPDNDTNQVLVFNGSDGLFNATFQNYDGSAETLQESYNAGTDNSKGEIILVASNPFFIKGSNLQGGDPIAAFTAVGDPSDGDSYQQASSFVLLRDGTNEDDLRLQFNGAFVQLRANQNIIIESVNGDVDIDGNNVTIDGNALASIDATTINMGVDSATTITIGSESNNATLTINANTTINGDLTVEGNLTTINTENLVVEDPLILLGNGNTADDKDLGLLLRYVASGSNKNAAFFRDTSANNNAFVLAQNVTVNDTDDVVTVIANSYADLTLANLIFHPNEANNGCDITIPDEKNNALDIKDTNENVLMSFNTNNSANDVIVTIYGNLNASDANNSGGGVISAVQFLTTSDATLKENIQTIENATDIVGNVRGVSYTWKNNQNMTEPIYGVLAQEVEQVLPGAVNTDGAGFKTVAYNQLVGVLFEAVKELTNQVSDLKTQILG